MITTLLEESHIPYDQTAVSSWMNRDALENETTSQHEKWGIPQSEWEGSFVGQKVDFGVLTSLSVPVQKATVQAISHGDKVDFVVLDRPPFFPTQAGQEGDRGPLAFKGRSIAVLDTVLVLSFFITRSNKVVSS